MPTAQSSIAGSANNPHAARKVPASRQTPFDHGLLDARRVRTSTRHVARLAPRTDRLAGKSSRRFPGLSPKSSGISFTRRARLSLGAKSRSRNLKVRAISEKVRRANLAAVDFFSAFAQTAAGCAILARSPSATPPEKSPTHALALQRLGQIHQSQKRTPLAAMLVNKRLGNAHRVWQPTCM